MTATPHATRPVPDLDQLARELDAVRDRALASRGEADARYIRRVIAGMRLSALAGRALLYLGIFHPAALVAGVLLLALAKIIENMEVGHNVMHGQYDWMNDSALNGQRYEWDLVGTSDNWRRSHNYAHHTYTNIKGVDDDVGYGILRLFPEQRWQRHHLLQPVYAVLFALLFQWGIAIQELRLGRLFAGKTSWPAFKAEFRPVGDKMRHQLLKDYVLFPLLAGPHALTIVLGNLAANGIRNLWTFSVIFCGHFTRDVHLFPKSVLVNECRGHWYLRQIQGSSNLTGGPVMNLLTGNLSHQIEHHLFPDVPAWRYASLAGEVRAICRRHGIHYNQGSLPVQCLQVTWRILRHAWPSRVPLAPRDPLPA